MFWKRNPLPTITVEELHAKLESGEPLRLIDVRTVGEFRSGHIEGSENVPIQRLNSIAGDLSGGRLPVLICLSGARSGMACRLLHRAAPNATNLVGGMEAWTRAGYPVVTG